MLDVRHSPDPDRNAGLEELEPRKAEGNVEWLKRAGVRNAVLLLGGTSLVEFRIRVAQSRVRQDLLPSFWSMAGFLRGGRRVYTVADVRDLDAVPKANGVQERPFKDFDCPRTYPNVAVIEFAKSHRAVLAGIEAVSRQRSLLDIPDLIVPWLGYVWGAGGHTNPLLQGRGLPSAALVETAHALAGIDITPGLASGSSCPEAIWQAATWWTSYYDACAQEPGAARAHAMRPTGRYALRQREAVARELDLEA